nr:MAG TPA: hypothetical protein [Caudoviricetes sp.]
MYVLFKLQMAFSHLRIYMNCSLILCALYPY